MKLAGLHGALWIFPYLVFFCVPSSTTAQTPAPSALTWNNSLKEALVEAKRKKKPVVINFANDGTPASKRMSEETLTNPEIQGLLKDCILVRVDPEESEETRKVAEKIKLSDCPSICVMNYGGEVVAGKEGFMDAPKLKEYLGKVLGVFRKYEIGYEEARLLTLDPVMMIFRKPPRVNVHLFSMAAGQFSVFNSEDVSIKKDGTILEKSRTVSFVYSSKVGGPPKTEAYYNSFYEKFSFTSVRIFHRMGFGRYVDVSLARDENLYTDEPIYTDARKVTLDLPPLEDGDLVDVSITRESRPYLPQHAFYQWHSGAFLGLKSTLNLVLYPELEMIRKTQSEEDRVTEQGMPDGKNLWRLQSDNSKIKFPVVFGLPEYESGEDYTFATKLTWNDVGAWFTQLCNGRDKLPEEARKRVEDLKQQFPDQKDLLRELHKWVTRDVRYVSVSLGLSSHQPHTAAETLANRYGDCKDQAFLLKTLCQEAGIDASLILLRTGYDRSIQNVPSPFWFNHCIMEATVNGEKIYLDPSYGVAPLGYLSVMCAKAQALRVGATTSELIRLPDYQDSGEGSYSKLSIHLNDTNDADIYHEIIASGPVAQMRKWSMGKQSSKKIRRQTEEACKEAGQKMVSLAFTDPEDKGDAFQWKMRYTAPQFAQKVAADYSISIAHPAGEEEKLDFVALLKEKRTDPYFFPPTDTTTEITEVTLPDKAVIKQNLAPVEIKTPFLIFTRTVETRGRKITVTDKQRFIGVRLPATESAQVLDAFQKRQDALDAHLIVTLDNQ